jgi:RNA polymerase sigma-70 factor (ECF subfamily)
MTGAPPVEATLTTADFVECYRAHYPRVIRALRLGGADSGAAEDIAQEAFARSLVHWRRVRRGSNPPGYVYRTAFRLYARRADLREEELPSDAGATADIQHEAATRLGVEAVLQVMPPRRRVCATLCFIVGFTPVEVAEALGIAEGTVRKQLEAARDTLRAAL